MHYTVADSLLERAATLRAQGLSWEAVAAAVKRTPNRCCSWPREHPVRWRKFSRRAFDELRQNAVAESMATLRMQLRADDDKTKTLAAVTLLKQPLARAKPAPRGKTAAKPASTRAIRMAEYVEGLSDGELEALLQTPAVAAAASDPSPGDAAPEPGPAEGPAMPECLP